MRLRTATPDDAARLLALRAEPSAARFLAVSGEDEAELQDVVVATEARGRGVASRAATDAARWLIADRGVHRVQLETFAASTAARRAFERAGFVHEGTRRRAYWREGAWQDGALYGLLADEV